MPSVAHGQRPSVAAPSQAAAPGRARAVEPKGFKPPKSSAPVAASREAQDRAVVTSLVIAFTFVLLGFGSLRFTTVRGVSQSEAALGSTLKVVHTRQGEFRMINQRFATWRELEARGAKLGPEQRVVVSNASPSHWFLSVRDTKTGVICDQTGELFDESAEERKPRCRE